MVCECPGQTVINKNNLMDIKSLMFILSSNTVYSLTTSVSLHI